MAYNDVNTGDILTEADWDSISTHTHTGAARNGSSALAPISVTINSGEPLGAITLSTSGPSGGSDGDLWLKY